MIVQPLSANAIQAFDDLTTQTVVYVVYAMAFLLVLLCAVISFSKSRGLINHRNAVTLRSMVNYLRTAESDDNKVTGLYEVLTKTKNDIAMLFYMYARIHTNFSSIEHYLNYKFFKKINRKRKPWGFTLAVILALVITAVFSISHHVGIQAMFSSQVNISDFALAIAVPLGLLFVWLLIRVLILMKYKMYWIEFENLFRKLGVLGSQFFATQEEYYTEFTDNILTGVVPIGGVKRRIERIIATTDPNDIESIKPYKVHPVKKKKEDPSENTQDQVQQPTPVVAANGQQQMMPSLPMGGQTRILKPHPETEAYLQAQAQMTNQLMQMMMQQSMQQSQVMQRALSSQQALASSVVQQNIMAMRLEAQQQSMLRPDLAKRLAEQTYTWPTDKGTAEKDMLAKELRDELEKMKSQLADGKEVHDIDQDIVVEMPPDMQMPPVDNTQAKPEQASAAKDEKAVKLEKTNIIVEKLRAAFDMLAPPPDTAAKEPDPAFPTPDRDLTHLENRLAEFFTAKVYMYD